MIEVLYTCTNDGATKVYELSKERRTCNCGGQFVYLRKNNLPKVNFIEVYINGQIHHIKIDEIPQTGELINLITLSKPSKYQIYDGCYRVESISTDKEKLCICVKKVGEILLDKPSFEVVTTY